MVYSISLLKKVARIVLAIVLMIAITFIYTPVPVMAESIPDGSGTATDPYKISSAADLYWLSENSSEWNKYYLQTSDIDLTSYQSGTGWNPIGNEDHFFTGVYDGQGYKINNLKIKQEIAVKKSEYPESYYIGLFGYLDGAVLKNLALENVDLEGAGYIGAVAGYIENSSIIFNSYATGTITGRLSVGGLIGRAAHNSSIVGSYTNVLIIAEGTKGYTNNSSESIEANIWHAGLVGMIKDVSVKACYSIGDVRDGRAQVGGLIGGVWGHSSIENSYSTGDVTNSKDYQVYRMGGFVGCVSGSSIKNCYSTGKVESASGSTAYLGSFAGQGGSGSLDINNFWDKDTATYSYSVIGTGKTTSEMQDVLTFSSWTSSVWNKESGQYPNFKKLLGIAGVLKAEDKLYDGNADANISIDSSVHLVSLTGEDLSNVSLSSEAVFINADMGNDKEVSLINLSLQGDDTDKYYLIDIAPTATASIKSEKPEAQSVSITGSAQPGVALTKTAETETLTGHYTYKQKNNDLEGTSIFKWYRSEDAKGKNKIQIDGANTTTYVIKESDQGKYISFEVTPVAKHGVASGEPVESTNKVLFDAIIKEERRSHHSKSTTPNKNESIEISINGKSAIAANVKIEKINNDAVVTVTADEAKIEEKMKQEEKPTVTIPVNKQADKVDFKLSGQLVKNMELKQAVLEVRTDTVTYVLPASQIAIDSISKNIGKEISLKDIEVNIEISKTTEQVKAAIDKAAKEMNCKLLVNPETFNINCIYGDKKVEAERFSSYVERVLTIPKNVSLDNITTAVVVDKSGKLCPVPTTAFKEDGQCFARINSLTNSTYSVIEHNITVSSVENHWSKNAVNDMASRLIISNPESFKPDEAITRGSFAQYITKALGIYRSNAAKPGQFIDVAVQDEFADAIAIASQYGIINGYEDGSFKANAQISREEAMTMYARAMDIVNLKEKNSNRIETYKDKKEIAPWAYKNVERALSSGVFNGRTEDTIVPKGIFNNSEAATAVRNLLIQAQLINK